MNNTNHNGAEHHAEAGGRKVEHQNKNAIAIFAYLWILIVVPFLTEDRNDPFVKFHLKQGVALVIFDFVGWFVAVAIGWFPIFGWLITWLWWLASFILALIGILNVLNGREQELPLIGGYAKNFRF